MRVLGIETSCDDSSAAVVDESGVLSNIVASQDELHAEYGGIVPELAARRHLETIGPVIGKAMERAGLGFKDLDAIAVTCGPGLAGSLLVGISTAQGLGLRTGLPIMGVNHLEGHVLSPLLCERIAMPFLAMAVSGGHTALYLVREVGDYAEVASTRDDAAGEAFDKAAKMLGLGFPGGRLIDELARRGNPRAVHFPRARVRGDRLALSFSGLKTALWDFLQREEGRQTRVEDICASFEEAVVDVLLDRAMEALGRLGLSRLVVVGGVSANRRLRERFTAALSAAGQRLLLAPIELCTDNGAMIAHAALLRRHCGLAGEQLTPVSRLPLGPRLSLTPDLS